MKKILLFLSVILISTDLLACSSAVISGKATPDGRPLLWKHRDSGSKYNCVKFFTGGAYSFIAVVNSADENPYDVWMGTNSAGFSIMNTQSYNLEDVENEDDRGIANGRVMHRALEICANIEDFCHFLDTLTKPSDIEANFGVIDAEGGAAMFEVDYNNYVMFDANNVKDAPFGYIARTNFSFTGDYNQGMGFVRYMTVDQALMPASASGMITPEWIFSDLSRSFVNPRMGIDLRSGDFNRPKTNGWFIAQDFISRKSSCSTVVVQGVKKGENPDLTIMWTVLGYPPTSVAMPLWVKNGDRLPDIVTRDKETKNSSIDYWSQTLADILFSYNQGEGTDNYFYWELLYNNKGNGFMQLLAPVEKEVFRISRKAIGNWYKKDCIDIREQLELYKKLQDFITEQYGKLFNI